MFDQFFSAISDFIHDNWMKVLTGFVLMGLGWFFGKRKARSDFRKREFFHRLNVSLNLLLPETEIAKRRAALAAAGGYKIPESQTPWQEIFRANTDQLAQGMVLKGAVKFQRIAKTKGIPRDNH